MSDCLIADLADCGKTADNNVTPERQEVRKPVPYAGVSVLQFCELIISILGRMVLCGLDKEDEISRTRPPNRKWISV